MKIVPKGRELGSKNHFPLLLSLFVCVLQVEETCDRFLSSSECVAACLPGPAHISINIQYTQQS